MMKKIKSIGLIIVDNRTQLLEIFVGPFIIWLVIELNLIDWAFMMMQSVFNYQVADNYKVVTIVFFYVYVVLHYNRNETMNVLNIYHNYRYIWYFFCAKILRFGKCNLIHVPIAMQLKLCINCTFKEYLYNEEFIPLIEDDMVRVKKYNWKIEHHIINLILEDTYPVFENQIPEELRALPTLVICRNEGDNFSRHFSQKFIDTITTEMHKLNDKLEVNLFATTNPRHNHAIAKSAFMNANNGEIIHLRVFQYERSSKTYHNKGISIF